MNDENDIILRQIKNFAQGLGYMLSKKPGDNDDVSIIFENSEIELGQYQQDLLHELKTHNFPSAIQLLESWRSTRINNNQYQRLFNWLQVQRFGLDKG